MSRSQLKLTSAHPLPPGLKLTAWTLLLCLGGCSTFFHPGRVGGNGKVNDAELNQTMAEWREAKPSIEKLAKLEGDLNFLLDEVSKMSAIGQVPGLPAGTPASGTSSGLITEETVRVDATGQAQVQQTSPEQAAPAANTAMSTTTVTQTPYTTVEGNFMGSGQVMPTNFQCAQTYANSYQKNLAFFSFPRLTTASSNLGALSNVEQHLPMLLSANLRNRHGLPAVLEFGQSFSPYGSNELDASEHIQTLGRQSNAQYLVSGEVDDMSLVNPNSVAKPGLYTRFVSGVHDLFNFSSGFDKRSRQFSFTLKVRDSITGQLVFAKQYKTFGKWNASANTKAGFAAPAFWQTDYGHQVKYLVGKASDELAGALQCQPFIARVDTQAGRDKLVIHSGANNGLQTGDSLELYQLIYEPVTGQYQRYAARMVKRRSKVYLMEVYPGHSVGHVVDEPLLSGQYIVKAL